MGRGLIRTNRRFGALTVYCLRTASPTAEARPSRTKISICFNTMEWRKEENCSLNSDRRVPTGTKPAAWLLWTCGVCFFFTYNHKRQEKVGRGHKLFPLTAIKTAKRWKRGSTRAETCSVGEVKFNSLMLKPPLWPVLEGYIQINSASSRSFPSFRVFSFTWSAPHVEHTLKHSVSVDLAP